MGVIFGFSSKSGDESNAQSKGIIESVAEVKDSSTSQKKITKLTDKWNVPLRKCAHASIYFVLSIFVMNFIFLIKKENKFQYYIIGILICFIYACTDEYHQIYVDGRTGRFTDALIDTAGATIGVIIVWIFSKIKNKRIINN